MKRIILVSLSILSGVCFGVTISTHLLITGALNSSYRAYIVQSGSMAPALQAGSIVITRSAPAYSPGEIITFTSGNSQITHRIVAIEGENFITKGDANEEPDSTPVKKSQIIGKSILSLPYLGYLADFVRTPRGFVMLVVIPAAIIVYEELKSLFKEFKKVVFKKEADEGSSQRAAIFLPIIGVVFLLLSQTNSFFTDNEFSLTNILGAAETFAEPEPTASLPPTPTPASANNLVINEFMSQPTGGEFDWVEIYNPTDQEVSLIGWLLDEDDQSPKGLDSLVSVPALGFVVFEYTTNAWLDNEGDTINLVSPENQVVDTHTYSGSSPGVSRGRAPDAIGDFKDCATTTKGSSNNISC